MVEPLDFLGKNNLVELTAYGKKHNLLETGAISVEPLKILGKDNVERTASGKKHNLLEKESWKRFKRIARLDVTSTSRAQ